MALNKYACQPSVSSMLNQPQNLTELTQKHLCQGIYNQLMPVESRKHHQERGKWRLGNLLLWNLQR
jgi:hypothetical protein